MVQNPHFASWTQLSAAAAAAAAASQPRSVASVPSAFQFPHPLVQPSAVSHSAAVTSVCCSMSQSNSMMTSTLSNANRGGLDLQSALIQHHHQQLEQQQQQVSQQQQQQQQIHHQHQLQLQQQHQLNLHYHQQQQQRLQQQQQLQSNHHQQQQQQQQLALNSLSAFNGFSSTNQNFQMIPTAPTSLSSVTNFLIPNTTVITNTTDIINNNCSELERTNLVKPVTMSTPSNTKRKSRSTIKKNSNAIKLNPSVGLVINSANHLQTSMKNDAGTTNMVDALSLVTTTVTSTTLSTTTTTTAIATTSTTSSVMDPSPTQTVVTTSTGSFIPNLISNGYVVCMNDHQTGLSQMPIMSEEMLFKMDPSLNDTLNLIHHNNYPNLGIKSQEDLALTKPYQCDQCFKRYSGMKSLKNHKLTHSDIKPHLCSICGKAFLRADKKRLHEISHLNIKPFECPTCKQRFTRSDKLKIHNRTHTGVRPYACTFCPKRFTRSDKLKIHERIHTKIKPYECSHCGKCFARSDKRRLHERTHLYGPRSRSGNLKKNKAETTTTSASTTSCTDPSQISAPNVAAAAASFLANKTSEGQTLLSTTVSSLNTTPNVFDFSSIMSTNIKAEDYGINFPSYSNMLIRNHNNSNGSSSNSSNAIDNQISSSSTVQTSYPSLGSISFPVSHNGTTPMEPYSQQPGQNFRLSNPSHHHQALASLAGIAQYHPAALFQAQSKQQQQQLQQQQQQQHQLNSSFYSASGPMSYSHAAQVMPFFVNSSMATDNNGSSNSSTSNNNNDNNDNQTNSGTIRSESALESNGSVLYPNSKLGVKPVSDEDKSKTNGQTEINDNLQSVSNQVVTNTNIAAVMAAAALGRQFHQSQPHAQPTNPHSYYSQFVAYPGSHPISNVSAFIQQQQQQQQMLDSQKSEESNLVPNESGSRIRIKSDNQTLLDQQQQQRAQFQLYNSQANSSLGSQMSSTNHPATFQDQQNQMLQHQQQVIHLHQQLQQQQQQQQKQQHGLMSATNSAASMAAFSLFPPAAHFIPSTVSGGSAPGLIPVQYAQVASEHPQQRHHTQQQQQQQQFNNMQVQQQPPQM